jgi:hypothetical protein
MGQQMRARLVFVSSLLFLAARLIRYAKYLDK